MSISKFFERLGVPLANSRWSLGARRPADGAVFLRGWGDRIKKFDGRPYMLSDHHAGEPVTGRSHGYRERRRHIDVIRHCASCYLIVCAPVDVDLGCRS